MGVEMDKDYNDEQIPPTFDCTRYIEPDPMQNKIGENTDPTPNRFSSKKTLIFKMLHLHLQALGH